MIRKTKYWTLDWILKKKKIALEISKINLTLPSLPMPVPCARVHAHALCPCPCPCPYSWNLDDRIREKFLKFILENVSFSTLCQRKRRQKIIASLL